jgi:hypothetical protein
MNLSIKDLEVSKELSCEERAAVRGGSQGNAAVPTITQLQNVETAVFALNGKGGAQNVDVDVDADQDATIKTFQKNVDALKILGF